MRGPHSIAFCAAISLFAASARAETDEVPWQFAPSSNWVVDYADDSCALRRAFRASDHQAILELRQFAQGDGFQVIVASKTIPRTRRQPKVRFEPDARWHEPSSAMYARYGDDSEGVIYSHSLWPNMSAPEDGAIRTDDERTAREKSITGLLVAETFGHDLVMQTGEMHAPMTAMRSCISELLTHWGIDAAAQRTLTRPARPINLASWARRVQENYPSEMVREGQSGTIRIRLIVDAGGKPTSCGVPVEMSHPSFEKAACKEMMDHARFEPALDARGSPIANFYVTTIISTIS